VLPTFNINRQVGVFADFANLAGKDENVHVEFYVVFVLVADLGSFTKAASALDTSVSAT
jgi:hypothetical protein